MSRTIVKAITIANANGLKLIPTETHYEVWSKDGRKHYGNFSNPKALLRVVTNTAFALQLAREVDEIKRERERPPPLNF